MIKASLPSSQPRNPEYRYLVNDRSFELDRISFETNMRLSIKDVAEIQEKIADNYAVLELTLVCDAPQGQAIEDKLSVLFPGIHCETEVEYRERMKTLYKVLREGIDQKINEARARLFGDLKDMIAAALRAHRG